MLLKRVAASLTEPKDVHSLEQAARDRAETIDRWNSRYIWLAAAALIVAFAVPLAQFMTIRRSKDLSDAQQKLIGFKDLQLRRELDDKDRNLEGVKRDSGEKIASLNARALEAEAGIADANRTAAEARQRAADADLARVNLEREIAPRSLSTDQQLRIANACPSLPGKQVLVLSYTLGAEGSALAEQIAAALKATRLRVQTRIGGVSVTGSPDKGVAVRGAASDSAFTACLGKALTEIGNLKVTVNGAAKRDPMTMMSFMTIASDDAPAFPAQPLPEVGLVMVFVGVKPFHLIDALH